MLVTFTWSNSLGYALRVFLSHNPIKNQIHTPDFIERIVYDAAKLEGFNLNFTQTSLGLPDGISMLVKFLVSSSYRRRLY